MKPLKILIVEDEILIADNIKRFLEKKGYVVVGTAINYEEAIDLFKNSSPDITLLDIRLNGIKTGIDVGHFINQQDVKKPFIFLTSQMDLKHIEQAKATFPDGYLAKPVQKDNLIAAIEIATHNFNKAKERTPEITLLDGDQHIKINCSKIKYLKADHVYVEFHRNDGNPIIQRGSLKTFISKLPQDDFVQCHRSYIVNLKFVDRWNNEALFMEETVIPLSRSKKKGILGRLTK